jgi:hypothetical protein
MIYKARMVGVSVKKHPVGVFSEAARLQGRTFHHPILMGRVLYIQTNIINIHRFLYIARMVEW